jgi:uncharacterized Zn-binding protein involved in type VI secretion
MSVPIALITSQMTHGARIISGSPDRYVDGVPVARLGDPVYCPKRGHGKNYIAYVNLPSQTTDEKTPAHVGARARCGAMIITGSTTTYVG